MALTTINLDLDLKVVTEGSPDTAQCIFFSLAFFRHVMIYLGSWSLKIIQIMHKYIRYWSYSKLQKFKAPDVVQSLVTIIGFSIT